MTKHESCLCGRQIQNRRQEKGVILMAVLMILVALSIYLPGYVAWTILDQRATIRQQSAAEARALAQAGLNRAVLDLYLDNDSWLDDEINGHDPEGSGPDPGDHDRFYTLYTETLSNGSYTVRIRYLYASGSFYDKRMWISSTGNAANPATGFTATVTLEQVVNYFLVKNLTQDLYYGSLQLAITEAISNNWNNNDFAITGTLLIEDIDINTSLGLDIRGCYDPTFTFRSCSDYCTTIRGNWTVRGGSDVTLGGIIIEKYL